MAFTHLPDLNPDFSQSAVIVIGCVKMLENRQFENAGGTLGSRRFENMGYPFKAGQLSVGHVR